jgi:hypothetical protein
LGYKIALPSLPLVLGQLVMAWEQGKIAEVNADNPDFQRLFAELAERSKAVSA